MIVKILLKKLKQNYKIVNFIIIHILSISKIPNTKNYPDKDALKKNYLQTRKTPVKMNRFRRDKNRKPPQAHGGHHR